MAHAKHITQLIERDLRHVWHPCSQMKDYESFKPLVIKSAEGSFIELEDGRQLIDGISSWWCKSLGHQHKALKKALLEQYDRFDHVIMANTTHETLVHFCEKLTSLMPALDKIQFASDGSSAVEIALKMSVHAQRLRGHPQRTQFMGLENAYHGETGLALSVSDLGIFREPYNNVICTFPRLQSVPYVNNTHDPLWQDCHAQWTVIEEQLEPYADTLCALIVEPLVQGSAGMRLYSPDLLRRLRKWTSANNVYLIADEIMTGIGRTGLPLACDYANITPDFLCLGKGLTGGVLPLSVCMTSTATYALFYDDYEKGNTFTHSHTHSGNALAIAVGLACLSVMEEENIYERAKQLSPHMMQWMQLIAHETKALQNLRAIGGVAAADLIAKDPQERLGYAVCQAAVEYGALLRPIGNTIYWLPPLNIDLNTLEKLANATLRAISDVKK